MSGFILAQFKCDELLCWAVGVLLLEKCTNKPAVYQSPVLLLFYTAFAILLTDIIARWNAPSDLLGWDVFVKTHLLY